MEIILYEPRYAGDFERLNTEWLEKYFWVEAHDREVLGNPQQYIIDPGGCIFFVRDEDTIIGTVALMKIEEGVYELTKMAVAPQAQGQRIGQKLMTHTLDYARGQGWNTLIIYSNRKLENAIHIYRKHGFEEIPIEGHNPYARGDIKMKLQLS